VVSVVTSQSVVDHQIKTEFPHHEISTTYESKPTEAEVPTTKVSIIDTIAKSENADDKKVEKKELNTTHQPTAVHDVTTESAKTPSEQPLITKKEEIAASTTAKIETSTVKATTDEDDDDEDEDYGNADTDDGLKATCIAALCGIGR
jgi:hypothetical protein